MMAPDGVGDDSGDGSAELGVGAAGSKREKADDGEEGQTFSEIHDETALKCVRESMVRLGI